ncbi:MAG: FlxA-like family protein [Roseburia sp.]|nr:FlxA-like family protein [Roseburia sp.]
MKINSVNGSAMQAGQMGMNQASDPVSKGLQKEIANLQRELQELSADKDIGMEEKLKKRQELQQQISDLNNQLRQRQIELRREKQQKASSAQERTDRSEGVEADGTSRQAAGLSTAGMSAMMSADSSIKQAKIQEGVAARMEGRVGVLKAEIKREDGKVLEAKQEELAEAEQKAQAATSAQMDTLRDANREIKDAEQAESTAEDDLQTGNTARNNAQAENAVSAGSTARSNAQTENTVSAGNAAQDKAKQRVSASGGTADRRASEAEAAFLPARGRYAPVDIRL